MEEHEAGKQYAMEDWISFLAVMCRFTDTKYSFGLLNENDIKSNIIGTMVANAIYSYLN